MNGLLNVMRAEFFKLFRKKRIYVLAGMYWVLLPVLVLVVARAVQANLSGSFVEEQVGVGMIVQELAGPFGLARVSLLGPGFMSPSFYMVIIALLAALFIGEERSQNMWKTTLVVQPNRLAVLAGKFLVTWTAFAGLLLGGLVAGFLFGAAGTFFLDTGFAGDYASLAQAFGLQVLTAGAAVAFAFLMIFLLRNVALGIVTVFFLPALVEGIYSLVMALTNFQPVTRLNAVFQFLRIQNVMENLPQYFFTANLYAPSRKLAASITEVLPPEILGTGLLGLTASAGHSVLVMSVYFVVFGGLLVWLFLRRDFA